MRTWLGVVLAIAACTGKAADKQPVAGSAAPAVAAAVGSAAGAGSGSAARAKKQASKEQLAAYRQHMKAGWAMQKQQKWAESVPEFEAAVAAIDGDQRALAELGWSAMNAGDYKKARRADDLAVRVALDPKVKASALFNLGTVEAKTGNVDDARISYAESLKLRPNKTVEAELAKLGAAPAVEKPFCPAGKDPCVCVYEDATETELPAGTPGCEVTTNPALPSTWKVYTEHVSKWDHSYVLDEQNNFIVEIGRKDDHIRHTEQLSLEKVETKTIGSHKVLWIQTHDDSTETIPHDDHDTMLLEGETLVTICVLGDDKTPTRCPLRDVVLARELEGDGPDNSQTQTDIALSDGTATVKLVSGPSCCGLDAVIGPQKLW